jgi:hypothetical protein
MGNKYVDATRTIAAITGFVGDEGAAIMNLSDPKNKLVLVSGGASAVKTAIGFLELGGKKVPYIGGFLSTITLSCTISKICADLHDPKNGTVELTDVISVIGDIAGIVSLIALFVAGAFVATLSAPVLIGLGILGSGLALISAGLSLITLHPSLQAYIIDTDKLSKFFDLRKGPRSFDNVKYIDIDAYRALPGSSLELVILLRKKNLKKITFPVRQPALAITPAMLNRPVMGNYHSSHVVNEKARLHSQLERGLLKQPKIKKAWQEALSPRSVFPTKR